MPTEQADTSRLKTGSAASSMIDSPCPSWPSMAEAGRLAPSAVTGTESLPRSPMPSNAAPVRRPSVSRGTSQIVLGPSAATGRLDQTYAVAWFAEVTQLLRAWRRTLPPSIFSALDTGAQNMLREPASEKASVRQVTALCNVAADVLGPQLLEHRGAGEVHRDDHRGRAALARDPLHHERSDAR